MCGIAEATLALGIASAASSAIQQQQQVDYQNEMNRRQYANTMAAAAANNNQVNLQQQQQREQTIQKKTENNLEYTLAKGKAITAAGEAGASGLSVGYLLDDLAGKSSKFNSSVDANYMYGNMALENQRQNIYIDAANTINSLKTPSMPDYLGAGLRIATSFNDYNKATTGKTS